jgi:hypothetical protein
MAERAGTASVYTIQTNLPTGWLLVAKLDAQLPQQLQQQHQQLRLQQQLQQALLLLQEQQNFNRGVLQDRKQEYVPKNTQSSRSIFTFELWF